jgi:hypothetical protein
MCGLLNLPRERCPVWETLRRVSPAPRLLRALIPFVVAATAGPALADHPAGACPPGPLERCETWSATIDDPGIVDPSRSDQFAVATLVSPSAVIAVVKDVAFDNADPYASTATTMLEAFDRHTGAVLWTVHRAARAYLSPHAAALSPDGRTVFVTGAAYDGFPVGAADSRVSTTAYDTSSGRELWTTEWDGRPDAVDNGNYIAVAPDGREVYVAGVTTAVGGGLDYVTLAYSAADGHQLWQQVYSGVKPGADDAVFGLVVDAATDMLYETGWSAGTAEFDNDYGTVAYALGHVTSTTGGNHGKGKGKGRDNHDVTSGPVPGQVMWVARYDGIGAQKSDRANAIAVDPTGRRVFVSGDSYDGAGYSYGTVAYDARTGQQLWHAAYAGGRGGFNSATTLAATAATVLVSGQATAPSSADGNDAATVAYDAVTGRQIWTASVAPANEDDFARGLQLAPDGRTAYLVTSDTPLVDYTALTRLTLTSLAVDTGSVRWQSVVSAGPLDSLSGQSVAVAIDGSTVAALGDVKRSANPLGSASQNVYDSELLAFAP